MRRQPPGYSDKADAQQVRRVIALRKDAWKYHDIAKELKLTIPCVHQIVKEHLPEMFGPGDFRRYAVKAYELQKKGLGATKIGNRLGIGDQTAYKAMCIGYNMEQRRFGRSAT